MPRSLPDTLEVYRSRSRVPTQAFRYRCRNGNNGKVQFGSTEGYGSRAEVRRRIRELKRRGSLGDITVKDI
jgi:uncharacterized protein YegP (UPF0339 family)